MQNTSQAKRPRKLLAVLVAAAAALTCLAAPSAALAEENPECSRPEWTPYAGIWSARHMPYHTDLASFPNSVRGQQEWTRRMILRGHNAWDLTLTECGHNDQENVTTDWAGDASGCNFDQSRNDNINCTDFGDMGSIGCGGFIACAFQWADAQGNAFHSDMRFSNGHPWWTYPDHAPGDNAHSGYLDLWGVASHEAGHRLGFNHATQPSDTYLTMYPSIGARQYHWRTLGRGDIIGMRARYPSRSRPTVALACNVLSFSSGSSSLCYGDGDLTPAELDADHLLFEGMTTK